MLATLTKQGDRMLLPLGQELLKQLHIDLDTPLNVETEGEVLIVSPVRDGTRRKKLQEALNKDNREYERMVQLLEDDSITLPLKKRQKALLPTVTIPGQSLSKTVIGERDDRLL